MGEIYVGCAGWNIPTQHAGRFARDGSHLVRYATRFTAVEINSSFYQPHRPATYARWAASVPDGFRFAVKVPREITHERRLVDALAVLERFLAETAALGTRCGPLLIQLPPSLRYHQSIAKPFLRAFRARYAGAIVCEPRHPTWFTSEPDALLADLHIARVAADPALNPVAARPGGWKDLIYYRLHGSPRMYYSAYSAEYLAEVARNLCAAAARGATSWCIFDNTAEGAATTDALAVLAHL